jgi:hypothetical protein
VARLSLVTAVGGERRREEILGVAQKVGAARPVLPVNWAIEGGNRVGMKAE